MKNKRVLGYFAAGLCGCVLLVVGITIATVRKALSDENELIRWQAAEALKGLKEIGTPEGLWYVILSQVFVLLSSTVVYVIGKICRSYGRYFVTYLSGVLPAVGFWVLTSVWLPYVGNGSTPDFAGNSFLGSILLFLMMPIAEVIGFRLTVRNSQLRRGTKPNEQNLA